MDKALQYLCEVHIRRGQRNERNMQIIVNDFKSNFAVWGACQAPHCFESHRKITQGRLEADQGPHTSSGKHENSTSFLFFSFFFNLH